MRNHTYKELIAVIVTVIAFAVMLCSVWLLTGKVMIYAFIASSIALLCASPTLDKMDARIRKYDKQK